MAPSESPFPKVLVVPSMVGGVLARAVELPDGSGRTEAWNGSAWGPTTIDFAEVGKAPPASPETLARLGVPTAP